MLKKNYKTDFKELGDIGEDIASKFMKKKGYKILDRNFKCKSGEIDIICKKKNEIVFVEVKTRRNFKYGNAVDSILPSKKKHILETAKYYLYIKDLSNLFVRFDVIEVYICLKRVYLNHINGVDIF